MAAIVGAGLSVAGAIFQALLRNPLAEPYVLGVTAGAGVGAALAIVAGITAAGAWTVPGMAFAGALGTIFLVQALARTPDGAVPVETMLLAGVTVSAVLNSLLMFIVSVAPSQKLNSVVWWLLGNLQATEWPPVAVVGAVVAVGLVVAVLWARDLNLLALGRRDGRPPGAERLAEPIAVLYRGLADHRRDGRRLRHHRLRGADRASCGATAGRSRPSPPGSRHPHWQERRF